MTREPERLPIDAMVTEDAAHRVLARAVELDARLATQVSIAQLREIAQEAGIAPTAFEEALNEYRVEQDRSEAGSKPGFFRSFWGRNKRSMWRGLTSHLAAFAIFIALISTAGRMNRMFDWNWQTYHAVQALVTAFAAAYSVKRGARVAALFFGTMTAAQLARYAMHLLFGIRTVQGGPTQWGLILASLLGVGFGAWLLRSRKPTIAAPPNAETDPRAERTPGDIGGERHPPASLILRPT